MVWAVCSMDEESSRGLSWAKETTTGAATAAVDADASGPFVCFHPGRGDQKSAEFLECDYEKNCTPLYRAIEDEDWEHVNHFLTRGKWPGKLFYDATTAADQARTWVTRYAPASGNNNNSDRAVLWSQLPLHLCCILDAPYEIVSRLLEMYPAAARSLDDQTNLPLHILLQRGASDRIVDLLLISFPEAVNVKGKNGLTPLECADDRMVQGRVFRAIFGLDGSTTSVDDQASRANSLLDTNKNENNSAFFGNIARTRSGGSSSKERPAAAAASDASRTDGMSTSKNLKSSVDVLRLNSLEYKTNRELAELRKELQAVALMAESRADVNELKAEIQNLRRQLRAKEHSAAAAAQLQLENSRGRKGNKGKGKKSSSNSIQGGEERPRSPFGRHKSGTRSRRSSSGNSSPGVQKSLSWSKSSSRSEQQQVDNTDSVSLCSSVVSSTNHEYEVSMLPKASMLDADSSDDSSDDDDSVNQDTESSSEHPEQPSPPRQQQKKKQPQQQKKQPQQQQQQLSKKKKKQLEKRRSKKFSQQQLQAQKKQQQLKQHQDSDSNQTDLDIILAHHPRQVDSRCQCVIL